MGKQKETSQLLEEMNLMMEDNRAMTVESLMFGDKQPELPSVTAAKPQSDAPAPQQPPATPAQGGQVDETQQPTMSPEDGEVKEIINQIRVLSLQGVAKLAEHPESPFYDICKRIWTMCDKNVETAKQPQQGQQQSQN